jgi:hypothetical protein
MRYMSFWDVLTPLGRVLYITLILAAVALLAWGVVLL